MAKSTILIVGLGNPGEQYAQSPHNAGFLAANELAAIYDLRFMIYEKLKSEVAEGKINGKKIVLAKPQTFMNKSGEAVLALTKSYKLKAENSLWLIHDDVDLELGKIKIIRNRGSAGHKGVEDVAGRVKTKDFVRFRIGIRPGALSHKRSKALMNKFVASKVGKTDQAAFNKGIKTCKEAVLYALEEGIEKAASIYNSK